VLIQQTTNRIPQRRPVRMFPLGGLVGDDELSCLAENIFLDEFRRIFSDSPSSSEVLEVWILRLGGSVSQWDVLMKGFVAKNAEVVRNWSSWCSITASNGVGSGEGMVVGAQRSGRRMLADDSYSMSALQHMLAAAS
jgi:hypothetical protein